MALLRVCKNYIGITIIISLLKKKASIWHSAILIAFWWSGITLKKLDYLLTLIKFVNLIKLAKKNKKILLQLFCYLIFGIPPSLSYLNRRSTFDGLFAKWNYPSIHSEGFQRTDLIISSLGSATNQRRRSCSEAFVFWLRITIIQWRKERLMTIYGQGF